MSNPTEKEQPMIYDEPRKLNKKLLRPLTGLPNHGTRWARAKIPR